LHTAFEHHFPLLSLRRHRRRWNCCLWRTNFMCAMDRSRPMMIADIFVV
jgi:hypothetical protein